MRKIVLAACVTLAPSCALADQIEPSHFCRKPHKPYEINDQMELNQFMDDVERYKRCIAAFVQEQEEAVLIHQQASQNAIDEWNRYVRLELN